MAEYPTGPCEAWTTLAEVRACDPDLIPANGFTDVLVQAAIDSASEILYIMSGQQFKGICQEIIRPCGALCCFCHQAAFACSCYGIYEIDLGVWPVVEIVDVLEDGVSVPATDYRVDDWRVLVKIALPPDYRPDPWPTCQYMDRELTEPDTFGVEVRYGLRPPLPGQNAARDLAIQFARACVSDDCDLPTRAAEVARRGIVFKLNNLDELQATDFIGIPSVDLFLKTYNPARLRTPSIVWSPDLGTTNRRTGT